jgi:nucleotide-binding universal stress UspA family protein
MRSASPAERPRGTAILKTIIAGYDGTRSAERALARAAELARAFDSTVVVVDVAAPESFAPMAGAYGLTPYPYYPTSEQGIQPDEKFWQQHRAHVQAYFAEVGVPVEFAGVVGQPAEEIVETAEKYKADLIVVGTREPGWLERLLSGSVSQGVARRAHCDVLIVHGPEEVESDG